MKRPLISLSTLVLSALGLFAQSAGTSEEALLFGYCNEYALSLGTSDASVTTAQAAIEITPDLAESWIGANVTKIHIGYGTPSSGEVTVYMTEELGGEPFYTQTAKMETKGGWNTVTLDSPYIVDGKKFYVGYSTPINPATDKPIGVDNIKTDNKAASFVNLYNTWEEVGKYYGSVCIRLSLTGDNLPQNSVSLSELAIPALVKMNTPFTAGFYVYNEGVKTVKDLDVICTINGVEQKNAEVLLADGNIPSGSLGYVEVKGLTCDVSRRAVEVEIKVVKVNGEEDEFPDDNVLSGVTDCAEKTYFQQIAVEEFTGTWCGWCPIGLVGMQYMKENYGDKGFNGIACHIGDAMEAFSYTNFIDATSKGQYPSAVVNRSIYFLEPSPEELEGYYNRLTALEAPAEVTLEASYSEGDNAVKVVSNVEFSFAEENAAYALAYVLVENNVGPYVQTNYFAGGAYGEMGNWSHLPQHVENTYYNEVARLINTAYGISGSVPSTVSAVTPYSYETTLSCENVEEVSECEVIALLLNTKTGVVVNSAKVKVANSGAGVESIVPGPTEGAYRVFNLQGVKVMETTDASALGSLREGLYIINGKKIYIK